MKFYGIRRVLKIMLFVLLAGTVFGFAVMWLWNWLMPALFSLHVLNFWQALGLVVLSKILFGSFRGGRGLKGDWRARFTWNMSPEERAKFRTGLLRWNEMTPEERDKLRAEMHGGCGSSTPAAGAPKA